MNEILTLPELANYLKTSHDTIYRKVVKGEIPGVKIGRSWRFSREVIDKWLEQKSLDQNYRISTAKQIWKDIGDEINKSGLKVEDIPALIQSIRNNAVNH